LWTFSSPEIPTPYPNFSAVVPYRHDTCSLGSMIKAPVEWRN
jgi:hypothetical protein